MSANYLAHEVVRMCMSAISEYNPALDPGWVVRTVLDIRINFMRTVLNRYVSMSPDRALQMFQLIVFEAMRRHCMSVQWPEEAEIESDVEADMCTIEWLRILIPLLGEHEEKQLGEHFEIQQRQRIFSMREVGELVKMSWTELERAKGPIFRELMSDAIAGIELASILLDHEANEKFHERMMTAWNAYEKRHEEDSAKIEGEPSEKKAKLPVKGEGDADGDAQ